MTANVSILTYNIHKGFGPGKINFQLPKMRDALMNVDADIVLLQEVQGEHKRQEKLRQDWPNASQYEYLAEGGWPSFIYAKNAVYQSGHHGNAILSKFDIDYWENVDVSTLARASRSLLHSRIHIPGVGPVLHVFCIHFGLFKHERISQVEQLIEVINKVVPEDEPLIIAGDFNDWRQNTVEELEKALNLQEAHYVLHGEYAKSFPAWRATLSMDRMYYRGMAIAEVACLNAKPWRSLSDHLPLWAKFTIDR